MLFRRLECFVVQSTMTVHGTVPISWKFTINKVILLCIQIVTRPSFTVKEQSSYQAIFNSTDENYRVRHPVLLIQLLPFCTFQFFRTIIFESSLQLKSSQKNDIICLLNIHVLTQIFAKMIILQNYAEQTIRQCELYLMIGLFFLILGESLNRVSVKVFFIDEGFYSNVGLSHIRPLSSKYATMLPAQSVHCILGGVQPLDALKEQKTLSFSKYLIRKRKIWQEEIFVGGTKISIFIFISISWIGQSI